MAVEARCTAEGRGYRCDVTISDRRGSTTHSVSVSAAELQRWGRGRSPEQLVTDSFQFLLERESKESILREFELGVIKRYFPEYDGG